MCYHNSLTADEMTLSGRYKSQWKENSYKPRYHENAFSFAKRPVITSEEPDKFNMYSWGLIPFWVKSKEEANKMRGYTPNAMCETVFEKPSFRGAIKTKRCLIPSTGFFEWRDHNKKKYPYFIKLKNEEIFSMGGIYDEWVDKETGEIFNTFSIITTEANPLMAKVHNVKKRMPLILNRETEKEWLYPSLKPEDIKALMKPFPEQEMEAHTIGKLITSRTENSDVPDIMKRVAYAELPD